MKSSEKIPAKYVNSSSNTKDTQLKEIPTQKIYFQKQSSNLLCGMHAVNNFLGMPKYTVEQMNEICYTLGEGKKVMNPHRHWFMDGDFDVNVLMIALGKERYEVIWHDQRKEWSLEKIKDVDGFLINIESNKGFFAALGFGCCYSGRHWLVIKKITEKQENDNQIKFALLDSLEDSYILVNELGLVDYLKKIERQNGQALLIKKQSQEEAIQKSQQSVQQMKKQRQR